MLRVPKAFHEVLGESQSPLSLLLVIGACGVAAAFAAPAVLGADGAMWRKVIALLLVIDIAAGAVANLTQGTNRFYATRPTHRWGFIALHVHLVGFAAVLGLPLLPYVLIWTYTIGATVLLNLLVSWREQRVLAGALLAVGWMALPMLSLDPLGVMVSALFIFKLCYAFAVDHDRSRPS